MSRPAAESQRPAPSSKRLFLRRGIPLALFLLVAIGCFATERMVQIPGSKLHVIDMGSGPLVVFESGVGEDTSTWNDVQPAIARFAHTVTYDRAGIGKSEPTASPRTAASMAADLHSMLHQAGFAPPYILVGHSLGGGIVQVFAHVYPKEVAGIVFVDPEDGRLIDRLKARLSPSEWQTRQNALDQALPNFSPAQRKELEAATVNGYDVGRALPLPSVPIILLSGTKKNPEFPNNPLEQDLKLELHNELLAKIPQAKHILSPNSRHYIQNEDPALVIQAVQEVVSSNKPRSR
jgi:pimeloyl-ACP methyl ester carboxylesterase